MVKEPGAVSEALILSHPLFVDVVCGSKLRSYRGVAPFLLFSIFLLFLLLKVG